MERVALVTGASRGIGRATALRLAEDGLSVAVNYRTREAEAVEVVRAVEARGGEGMTVRADVAAPADVAAMVARVDDILGPVQVLVNNAGIYRRATLPELDLEQWQRTLDVNLTGAYLCLQAVAPGMRDRGWGRVVNITSQIAHRGTDHGADYAASKAGLLGLTKAAARELAPHGVTVNAVAPGTIDTDLIAAYSEADRRRRAQEVPLGRIGTPEDVAAAVSFLASEDGAYVTGITLHVNGGYLIL